MNTIDILDFLIKARERIQPNGWVRGTPAGDAKCLYMTFEDLDPNSGGYRRPAADHVSRYFKKANGIPESVSIVTWNDSRYDVQEVTEALDWAIRKAQKEAATSSG
jgi:hypothetical protein